MSGSGIYRAVVIAHFNAPWFIGRSSFELWATLEEWSGCAVACAPSTRVLFPELQLRARPRLASFITAESVQRVF